MWHVYFNLGVKDKKKPMKTKGLKRIFFSSQSYHVVCIVSSHFNPLDFQQVSLNSLNKLVQNYSFNLDLENLPTLGLFHD